MNLETFLKIIEIYVNGHTLEKACAAHNRQASDVLAFVAENDQASNIFARSQEYRAEVLADKVLEISDDPEIDAARQRNMILARQWLASKLMPKKFGDKIDVNVNNSIDLRVALDDARKRVIEIERAASHPKPSELLTHVVDLASTPKDDLDLNDFKQNPISNDSEDDLFN